MSENIPTEPGYYWHRDIDEGNGDAYDWEPQLVIRDEVGGLVVLAEDEDGATVGLIVDAHDEWGPRIPDPDEMQEKAEDAARLDAAIKRSVKTAHNQVRDDLARKLMVGVLASFTSSDVAPREAVNLAYEYADAMLERSNKQ